MRLARLAAVITMLSLAGALLLVVPASAAPKATGISANGEFGCAVMADHSVECWGNNLDGELGIGNTSIRYSLVPLHVVGIFHAVSVTAGETHACALLQSGRIKCWGANGEGQLGDGSQTDRSMPVYVGGILHATKVSAGNETTCAIRTVLMSGDAECWGYNGFGQLGDGTTTDHHVPVQVSGMAKNVTWISTAGDDFSCGVQAGVTKCWGDNSPWGQLGDNSSVDSHTPHKVSGLGSHTILVNTGYY